MKYSVANQARSRDKKKKEKKDKLAKIFIADDCSYNRFKAAMNQTLIVENTRTETIKMLR